MNIQNSDNAQSNYSRFCPHCGAKMATFMQICPECGKQNTVPAEVIKSGWAKSSYALIAVCVIVSFIAGGTGLLFWQHSSQKKQIPTSTVVTTPPIINPTPPPTTTVTTPTAPTSQPDKSHEPTPSYKTSGSVSGSADTQDDKSNSENPPPQAPEPTYFQTSASRLINALSNKIKNTTDVDDLREVDTMISYYYVQLTAVKQDFSERGRYTFEYGYTLDCLDLLSSAVEFKIRSIRDERKALRFYYKSECDMSIHDAEMKASAIKKPIWIRNH